MKKALDDLHNLESKALDNRIDPSQPVCCFCIPISWGINLIGLCMLFDFIGFWTQALRMEPISELVMIFYYIAVMPCFISLVLFGFYFYEDSKQSRKFLADACGLMILAEFIAYLGIAIGSQVSENIPSGSILTFIPVNGLAALMYFYFRLICKEWHQLGPNPGAPLGFRSQQNKELTRFFPKGGKTLAELSK